MQLFASSENLGSLMVTAALFIWLAGRGMKKAVKAVDGDGRIGQGVKNGLLAQIKKRLG